MFQLGFLCQENKDFLSANFIKICLNRVYVFHILNWQEQLIAGKIGPMKYVRGQFKLKLLYFVAMHMFFQLTKKIIVILTSSDFRTFSIRKT